jgi:hypothetical protein
MLNLDTHILIKALEASGTRHERTVLTEDPEWSISAIVSLGMTKLKSMTSARFRISLLASDPWSVLRMRGDGVHS